MSTRLRLWLRRAKPAFVTGPGRAQPGSANCPKLLENNAYSTPW